MLTRAGLILVPTVLIFEMVEASMLLETTDVDAMYRHVYHIR